MKREMKYYVYRIKYKKNIGYYLWYSEDEKERFLIHKDKLRYFSSIEDINHFKESEGFLVEDDGMIVVIKETFFAEEIDCNYFLELWNLAEDVCASFGQELRELISKWNTSTLYEKIFWGNNFEALTPPGKEYIPTFDREERLALNELHKKFQAVIVSKL
ncbi:MAG: hypothetical protein ACLU9N_10790 [Clostridia bacterium]